MRRDAEKAGIVAETGGQHPGTQLFLGGKRPVGQISPVTLVPVPAEGIEQVTRMVIDIDRFQATQATLYLRTTGIFAGPPVFDRKSNRLTEFVMIFRHAGSR
jgi:hypothetical protein